MEELKSVLLPIVIMLIMAAAITVIVIGYFRYERRRAEALAAELERNREVAERSARQVEQLRLRIDELTNTVSAVDKLLRSVE